MPGLTIARRKVLRVPLACAAATCFSGFTTGAATTLTPTPAQTAGPFYPASFPEDSDNNLLHVSGRKAARGVPAKITGQVLNIDGQPVSGARVEIWQCDTNGRYHHVQDGRTDPPRDEDFQGYGLTTTNAEGRYEFLTIKPVPYPGRAPHIHFAVSGRGFERFITQMYVAGDPRNGHDSVLTSVRDPAARARLIVALQPSPEVGMSGLAGTFEIVLAARV